jgi:PEP-CTERM motif-containing protein
MRSWFRGSLGVVAVLVVLLCAGTAKADSIQMSYTGPGINGFMNLTGTPLGWGLYQITAVSGFENGIAIAGLAGSTGLNYFWLPDGSAFIYDNLMTPNSYPVFGNPGLLFSLAGSTYPENIYWGGTSYMEARYIGGGNFPSDFIITPLDIRVSSAPEPSALALFGVGLLALSTVIRRTRKPRTSS